MSGEFAQGTLIAYENPTDTWNTIKDVLDYDLPGESAEEIDVTSHSSPNGRKEYVAGLVDSDEMSIPINYDNTETHHNYFRDNIGATVNFRVTWLDGATTEFAAIVKDFKRAVPMNGVYGATIMLRKTGDFTETAA